MDWLRRVIGLRDVGAPDLATFHAGDIVSVITEDRRFGVVKVLAVDAGGVHARLYAQRFDSRPGPDELGALSIASVAPEDGHPFSIGHLPLRHATFRAWSPEPIGRNEHVDESELEGYRMSQDAEAGYF